MKLCRTVTMKGTLSKSLQVKLLNAQLWPIWTEGTRLEGFVCTKGELMSFRGFSLIDPRAGDASGHPVGPSHTWPQKNVLNAPKLFTLKGLRENFVIWVFFFF